ncbi:MAG: DedA family protein [Neomegalonema sp.]|nr:DedA family protein [Neomegalonema sp.]
MTEFGMLLGLFVAAFGAATILPFQSEVVLVAVLGVPSIPVWLTFLVATAGNTLGSVANYALGRAAERFKDRRWFPASQAQLEGAQRWFERWGIWTLLLSWAPFADPITVVAGVMRTPFWTFLALVLIAKAGRYAAVIWLCDQVSWCGAA